MDEKDVWLPPFEFHERKSRLNKLKHGIDFVERRLSGETLHFSRASAAEAARLAFW